RSDFPVAVAQTTATTSSVLPGTSLGAIVVGADISADLVVDLPFPVGVGVVGVTGAVVAVGVRVHSGHPGVPGHAPTLAPDRLLRLAGPPAFEPVDVEEPVEVFVLVLHAP